jgi:hypothetical protein
MIAQMQEMVSERTSNIVSQLGKMRRESIESVREVAVDSADAIKAWKSPVRTVARSSIKFSELSQGFAQNLIELQTDVITSAINDAALRLERASRASNIIDLVRDQIDMFPATRARVSEDAERVVNIFKHTSRDLRNLTKHTFERVIETAEEEVPAVKTAKRKVKKVARKTGATVRKAKAKATA